MAKKKGGITFHLLLFHHTLDPLLLDPTMDIHPPKTAVRHGCRKICSLDENTHKPNQPLPSHANWRRHNTLTPHPFTYFLQSHQVYKDSSTCVTKRKPTTHFNFGWNPIIATVAHAGVNTVSTIFAGISWDVNGIWIEVPRGG